MYRNAAERRAFRLWAARLPLLLIPAVLLFSGCQSVAPVVKIGLVAPFEGRHRAIGYDVLYSARLAVREINAAGGIGGTRVALVALDDGGEPEFAKATAQSLLLDPGVVAVVGHWLPETTEMAAPLYERESMPFVPGGEASATDPQTLDADFVAAYEQVTPFDETPGPYAQPAYSSFRLVMQAFADAQENSGEISRQSVQQALENNS